MEDEKLLCRGCGAELSHPHGTPTKRWMRSAAAGMVALPCLLAAMVVWTRSPVIAGLLGVCALAAIVIAVLIARSRPRCPRCGHRSVALRAAVAEQQRSAPQA